MVDNNDVSNINLQKRKILLLYKPTTFQREKEEVEVYLQPDQRISDLLNDGSMFLKCYCRGEFCLINKLDIFKVKPV